MTKMVLLAILLMGAACAAQTQSVIRTRLDDPKAVYLTESEFGAHGNGQTDDSVAIQAAIDKAENRAREGILFVPSGRYRLTRTVYIWPGVRLFGYGATRPVFLLGDNTPGFQKGIGVMVMFTGFRSVGGNRKVPFPPPGSVPPNDAIADANPGTFYSAMSNIDFEIGAGNPAAIAIRFHVAQHSYLSHMNFHIGSGLAALTQIGNEAEDLHFYGGRYGILTEKTSPAWQFTLIDSVFEGQRDAAIRDHEAGLTLIHDTFRNVPTGIDIDPGYSDELWVKDSQFERISGSAVVVSNEKSPLTEVGFENVLMSGVATLAVFRESGKKVAGKGPVYRIETFNYGLLVPEEGVPGTIGMVYKAQALSTLPAPPPAAIRPLPPTEGWTNVHTLGVVGNGTTDDTAAIQKAIDGHRVLYFPSGHYVVRDTIALKSDTILVGLHPTLTQLDLPDGTPGYQGIGRPRPVIDAPQGGSNILSGFGIFTGGINPRATGVLWHAGETSLIDDVRFLGGHGSGTNPYNNNHTADPDLHKRWDSQYPSLWVMHGGGTFADIWTPDTFAQAGFYVSDTKVPGHVYELSNEHHVRNEIKLDHVENWDLNAPQTEEEAGESPDALSLELDWSKNIIIANYHAYRVTRSRAPFPAAVRLYNSSNIHFRNVHVNAESGYATCDDNGCGTFLRVSKYPYSDAIQDVTRNRNVREREFAVLDVAERPTIPADQATASPTELGLHVQKLADGFFSISGAAVDDSGKLYFTDHQEQRIYGWSPSEGLTIERDNALDPVNLGFDKTGDLMVISSAGPEGTVYCFRPGSPATEITVLAPQESKPHPDASALLPGNYWNNGEFKDRLDPETFTYTTLAELFAQDVSKPKAREYVSPDGSLFLPAGRVFQQGPATEISGWRFSDNLDTYGFIKARPGKRIYISSESEDVTYIGVVGADGTLSDLKPFVQRGGESVAVDEKGAVYVANGQIFVYNPAGRQIGRIDVPARPIDIVFGGKDRRTLFVLTHHALFAVKMPRSK